MIPRNAEKTLVSLAKGYPVVAVTGPRQSGKSTLATLTFKNKQYVNLEDIETVSLRKTTRKASSVNFETVPYSTKCSVSPVFSLIFRHMSMQATKLAFSS